MGERQVIYLKSRFPNYFLGGVDGIKTLMNTLTDLNSDKIDMSKVTLDLQDVIINQAVEGLLYNWMSEYDLDVIDTTVDEKMVWNDELNDYEKVLVPIQFRQDALDAKKRQLSIQKMSVDITNFYVYDNEERKEVFTKEESATNIVKLISERRQAGNNNKLLLSIKNVNQSDTYSLKQISAFLISAVNHVEIAPIDTRSVVSIYGILPTISQICYDFSMGETAWHDIKKKHKVGSELYFSSIPSEYQKARVVKSDLEDEEGNLYSEKDYLTEEEKDAYYTMYLEYDVYDEDGNFVKTNDFKLRATFIIAREVLIFPCAIFDGGTSDGFPTKEELAKNMIHSDVKERKRKVIAENDAILLNSGGNENKDTDWIAEYRKLMRAHYKDKGIEIPKIDLMRIVRGERSPFIGLFYGMDSARDTIKK